MISLLFGSFSLDLMAELERSRELLTGNSKKLSEELRKARENQEIEILNQRNRVQIQMEKQLQAKDAEYKEKVQLIDQKIRRFIDSKTRDVEELKEQVRAKERLVKKYEELLEKQRKDFLMKK